MLLHQPRQAKKSTFKAGMAGMAGAGCPAQMTGVFWLYSGFQEVWRHRFWREHKNSLYSVPPSWVHCLLYMHEKLWSQLLESGINVTMWTWNSGASGNWKDISLCLCLVEHLSASALLSSALQAHLTHSQPLRRQIHFHLCVLSYFYRIYLSFTIWLRRFSSMAAN